MYKQSILRQGECINGNELNGNVRDHRLNDQNFNRYQLPTHIRPLDAFFGFRDVQWIVDFGTWTSHGWSPKRDVLKGHQ